MSTPIVPLPPTGHFVSAVRESSRAARGAANIKIETSSIKQLLLSPAFTSTYKRLAASHGYAFPFKFPSSLSELNFLSVLSVLNFASGYRVPLHQLTGRGAYDNIRALIFALYLTSATETGGVDVLSAEGLRTMREQTVAELMGLSLHQERPHESIPGVTVGELGGPGYEVAKLVTGAMNSTGEVLVNGGYRDLGSFVLEALKEGEKARSAEDPDAEINLILERLVRAFPALQDMAEVDGKPIYCFKKALILIHAINMRFSSRSPAPFPIPDTRNIPIFSDNVIPSMLVHLGVIDLSASSPALGLASLFPSAGDPDLLSTLLAEAPRPEAVPAGAAAPSERKKKEIPSEGPVLSVAQAFVLRAAAIDACELIVQVAHELELEKEGRAGEGLEWLTEATLPDVDGWLWAVAKDRPDYRRLKRFVLMNTVFF